MQQVDDPPYLSVGTEVSAKYKGAFCEAKVRKVVRNIKCKVAYKLGLGSGTVSDDQVKGDLLRVGAAVEVRHPDKKEFVEATITKIQDCSQYTVVFDDGDITTLRRSALCLKSGRHFNESETLDQLPLTHPEHFGNPVIGGRRGRRNLDLSKKPVNRSRQMPDDSSDDDEEPITTKRRIIEKEEHIGKVVCIENTETKKKSSKENWFPALVVAPTAQDAVRIRVKDEYLVRSFKDGRYYTVPKKEAAEFSRDKTSKQDADAVQAALEYLNSDVMPPHWDRDVLFSIGNCSSDSDGDDDDSDTSDDEPTEEKDHFVAQLYKYMDDRGTPLNKGPSIVNKDVDLYRLYRAVKRLNGYNRVTSQSQWKQIATRLGYSPVTTSIQNLVKQAYKKFLLPFEEFDRKLGCTMVAHPRANRIKGRSLVRANSVASPKPDKESSGKITAHIQATTSAAAAAAAGDESENTSESGTEMLKVKRKLSTSSGKVKALVDKYEEKVKEEIKDVIKKEIVVEEMKETVKEQKDLKETTKKIKEIKESKDVVLKDVKIEKDQTATNQAITATRMSNKVKDENQSSSAASSTHSSSSSINTTSNFSPNTTKKERPNKRTPASEPENRKTKKRKADVEVEKPEKEKEKAIAVAAEAADFPIEVGDKLKVYYHEQKVTYEAKVIEIAVQQKNSLYLVHYTGWNTRYDEWVPKERIAENLTNNKTNKKAKTGGVSSVGSSSNATGSERSASSSAAPSSAKSLDVKTGGEKYSGPNLMTPTSKILIKRGRGSSRGESQPPRSTTPSSVASNSSRTKSPATPAQRRTTRGQPNSIRRTSNNTDISSMQTDSDTDSDEPVKKPANRKLSNSRSTQAMALANSSGANKTNSTNSTNASSEEESVNSGGGTAGTGGNSGNTTGNSNHSMTTTTTTTAATSTEPKSRAFDLNQIRNEIKAFKESKAQSPDPLADVSTSSHEKKFDYPTPASNTSNTESGDSASQDMPKAGITSDSKTDTSSESDSYGDDDSQFSDKTTTLENLSEKLQEKFKAGKLETDVFKKLPAASNELVDKVAILKASGIEKIIKNSLADKPKALPEKMTMKALCERSPLKQMEKEKAAAAAAASAAAALTASSTVSITASTLSLPTNAGPKLSVSHQKFSSPKAEKHVITKLPERSIAPEKSAMVVASPQKMNIDSKAKPDKLTNFGLKDRINVPQTVQRSTTAAPLSSFLPVISSSPITPAPASVSTSVSESTKSTDQSKVVDSAFATDIYEFKEPEPFEFEAVKKLSPESQKSKKKPPFTEQGIAVITTVAPLTSATTTTISTTPAGAAQQAGGKKVKPVKEVDKLKAIKIPPQSSYLEDYLDDQLHSPPLISPTSMITSAKVESIFDSLRKSPSFNLTSQLSTSHQDDAAAVLSSSSSSTTSTTTITIKEEKQQESIPTVSVKPTFISSFVETKSEQTLQIFEVKPPTELAEKQKRDLSAAPISVFDNDDEKPIELETAKKILLAEDDYALELPKEKPSSIADKVLKALNQQQQQQQNIKEDEEVAQHLVGDIKIEKAASPVLCPKEDLISTQTLEPPIVPVSLPEAAPKIELPALIKKDIETAPKKPVLSSPEHKLDILESIAPKNNDLSETIQKLESVIQQTAEMNHITDESSDSTDSEQRLIIEDESLSSETQTEFGNDRSGSSAAKRSSSASIMDNQMLYQSNSSTVAAAAAAAAVAAAAAAAAAADAAEATAAAESMSVLAASAAAAIPAKTKPDFDNQDTDEDEDEEDEEDEEPEDEDDDDDDEDEHLNYTSKFGTRFMSKEQQKQLDAQIMSNVSIKTAVDLAAAASANYMKPIEPQLVTSNLMGPTSHPIPFKQKSLFCDETLPPASIKIQDKPNILSNTTITTTSSVVTLTQPATVAGSAPQPAETNESISLLLCEETIPGSPTPPCHKDSGANDKKPFDGVFVSPHPTGSDIKSVPMDIEITTTMPMSHHAVSSAPIGTAVCVPTAVPICNDMLNKVKLENNSPNSSMRDSLSQDDSSEDIRKHEQDNEFGNRKRRHSKKMSECENVNTSSVCLSAIKHRRKGNSRRNTATGSDSEDNNDFVQRNVSNTSGSGNGVTLTSQRSSKPCQFNFLVQLEPALNSNQRIAILNKKIQDLRKTYNNIKSELASIDRRRKKLRRRERENKKNLAKMQTTNN